MRSPMHVIVWSCAVGLVTGAAPARAAGISGGVVVRYETVVSITLHEPVVARVQAGAACPPRAKGPCA
jgi:hypothetical protein